jgi:hypothetical protein
MHASVVILAVAAAYALIGCTVAGWVMLFRRAAFDPDARDGSWGFRIVTFPGAVLIWPALLIAARRAKGGGR